MKYSKFIFFMLIILGQLPLLHALEIDQNSSNVDLMSRAMIYIDEGNQRTKEEIVTQTFRPNHTPILSLGFAPERALWITFTLTNNTHTPLEKTLEYANALTEEILFFDGNQTITEGAWHIPTDRIGLNPLFKIKLQPQEERVFYIKAHSTISTTIAQLILWNHDEFMAKEYTQRSYLLIFFTIVLTLLIYNLFIYSFTKDRAYLYYIIYLLAIILNELIYSGILQRYLLSSEEIMLLSRYMILISAFLIIAILLFTREFLQTRRFRRLDTTLKVALYLVPLLSLLSCNNILFNANIILLFLPLGGLIIFVAFYALFHGIKEAQFYVLGWSLLMIALVVTNLQTLGVIEINESVKYLNNFAFVAEIFLFSIALAHRIKITNERLTAFQHQEQQRLQKLVDLKTKKLKTSLQKEALLYRELNHRVKNNFQMILSLVKLQILQASTSDIKSQLITVRDRIHAIAHLYEMLKIETDKTIDTQSYFENIVQSIQQGFQQEIKIIYQIDHTLPMEQLIYCGLILNELVTNSFKYAFEEEEGEITISLYQQEQYVYFVIQDNGRGYNQKDTSPNALGILIIQTLVEKQLLGKLQTNTTKGVENIILWPFSSLSS